MMIHARALTVQDIKNCMVLTAEAGWNQNELDWHTILTLGEGSGLFIAERLVASAAIMPYGNRIGWICMVLVTSSEQRKGHATRLLKWAISRLKESQLIPGLDATPAGREVYRKLGFEDIYGITRLQAKVMHLPSELPTTTVAVQPLLESHMEMIAQYDRPIFGADRDALLRSLRERRPHLAFIASDQNDCHGFVLAREGQNATQIGPLVAQDASTARALLSAVAARVEGSVFIDLVDGHTEIRTWLEGLGFTAQRSFTRMLATHPQPIDDAARIVALTGPEFA